MVRSLTWCQEGIRTYTLLIRNTSASRNWSPSHNTPSWLEPPCTFMYTIRKHYRACAGLCASFFKRARAPRHFLLGEGNCKGKWGNCKFLLEHFKGRATRQWPEDIEAIAFVASLRYQACLWYGLVLIAGFELKTEASVFPRLGLSVQSTDSRRL